MQIPEKGKQLFPVSFDLFMSLSIVSRSVPELVEGPTASLIPVMPRNPRSGGCKNGVLGVLAQHVPLSEGGYVAFGDVQGRFCNRGRV